MKIWRPTEDDPRYSECVGTRSAVEVFEELKQRLDSMGLLPDEYFELDTEWKDGKPIPKGARFFTTTDYGGSEGVYLDGYLKWYEDGKPVTKSFFTGKTLEETGSALDRMFLIASAITKAFHGYGRQPDNGTVLYLNAEEKKELVEALVEKRERMLETESVEKLLRRATGSITAYMDTVRERPMWISDHDKMMLAIRDGEFETFKTLLPKCADSPGELLKAAAGRPGNVGSKMTVEVIAAAEGFSEAEYMEASRNAVDAGDTERVKFLMEQAQGMVGDLSPSYYGEVINYACGGNKGMGHELIAYAPSEWIAGATPDLLIRMSCGGELRMAQMLVDKGLQPGDQAENVLQNLTCDRSRLWMAEQLLKNGMEIRPNDYYAMNVCVRNGAVEAAKLLLDQGMDFEQYRAWAEKHSRTPVDEQVCGELQEHWDTLKSQRQEAVPEEAPAQGQAFGGMTQ